MDLSIQSQREIVLSMGDEVVETANLIQNCMSTTFPENIQMGRMVDEAVLNINASRAMVQLEKQITECAKESARLLLQYTWTVGVINSVCVDWETRLDNIELEISKAERKRKEEEKL